MKYLLSILLFGLLFSFACNGQNIPSNGLVAWYPFNNTYDDLSENNNHAFPIGDVRFIEDRNGVSQSAILLNGSSYVVASNSDALRSITTVGTISGWIRVDAWAATNAEYFFLCEKPETDNTENWQFTCGVARDLNSLNPPFSFLSCNPPFTLTRTDGLLKISEGEWNMITYAFDDTSTIFYLNGKKIEEKMVSLPSSPNNGLLEIGRSFGGGLELSIGAIDELLLYNRKLNSDEVMLLFNDPSTSTDFLLPSSKNIRIYPNPSSKSAFVEYNLSVNSRVTLEILDLNGKLVNTYHIGRQLAGIHQIQIDRTLPKGVYWIKLSTQSEQAFLKWVVQ